MHHLIERQADRTPDAEALLCRGTALSYQELDAQANRVARLLAGNGVRAGDRVGVCLPRDERLVVALLGVLKAGACYVALDPAYPEERLRFIAGDSQVRLVLTDRRHRLLTAETLCWEDFRPADFDPARPDVEVSPRDLAYLIYTSGSTGRPKGVRIEHRSVAQLLAWTGATFDRDELSGVLAGTSACFDLSVFEIFGPLANGGRCILVDNVLALAALGPDSGVRLVNTVPSAMRELIAAGAVPSGVHTVCLAGEVLTAELARRVWRLPGLRRLLNLYGPSEDTTYSTWAEIGRDDPGSPPIGVPLPGTRAYVLDESLRPVAHGAEGELHLAGAGLARGYHNRPKETDARFVPDPFAMRADGLMYRTGDRVRYREDGQLEFLGRLDDQVKLRGYRIELGEVAAELEALPGVREATAAIATGPSGDPVLVGYLVGTRDADALHSLRQRLPGYLVPGELVWLDRLPRTPNGKTDRAALPAPPSFEGHVLSGAIAAESTRGSKADGELPAGEWEQRVADICREVLGVRLGGQGDFFAAGGDSLLAVRFAARLRAATARPVTIRAIFEHPTMAELAAHVAALPEELGAADVTGGGGGPLSPAQQRMWFLQRLNPGDTSYLLSFLIRCEPAADPRRLAGALQAVVAAHEALRTSFALVDGHPVQHVHPQVDIPVQHADLPDATDDELRRLAREDAARPLEPSLAPLLRCRMVTCGGKASALVLTVHHIVFDGWSLEILLRELVHHYRDPDAAVRKRPGPAVFARRQLAWLETPSGNDTVSALAQPLTGAPELLALPTDHPRPPVSSSEGGHGERPLPISWDQLRSTAAAHRVTPHMFGLAAFAVLLQRWSGLDDLVIGSAFAGRTDPEAEDTIGCFVNLLPTRLRPDPAKPFSALLEQTYRASVATTASQDVPLESLIDRLRPRRTPAHSPLVQVSFGVARPAPQQDLGDLVFRAEELPLDNARLDLTLWLREDPRGLLAQWTYRTDLFRDHTIATLHDRYAAVLKAALAHPQEVIGNLAEV